MHIVSLGDCQNFTRIPNALALPGKGFEVYNFYPVNTVTLVHEAVLTFGCWKSVSFRSYFVLTRIIKFVVIGDRCSLLA